MLMDTNGNTKKLLIKDLSSRLPYGVIVDYNYNAYDLHKGNYVKHAKHGSKYILTCSLLDVFISPRENEAGEYIKPYLFPLSSMTEEQSKELDEIDPEFYSLICENGDRYVSMDVRSYDWLNKNHFDYRNLIDKNLAIDCTNLNIY